MDIESTLLKGQKILSRKHLPKLESEILLADILGQTREYLISKSNQNLPANVIETFIQFCIRRDEGEPISHITKKKEFFGIDLFVNDQVLIPRPETELLVENVLSYCQNHSISNIIEIGTGSGNIAIAIAKNTSSPKITAGDISREALKIAQKNIKNHQLENRITLVHSDLLESIYVNGEIIVANLPYIGTKTNSFISQETKNHEPHVALFGGETGLELYNELFQQIKQRTVKPHLILGEIGFSQHQELEKIISIHFPKASHQILPDLAGLDRYFIIHL